MHEKHKTPACNNNYLIHCIIARSQIPRRRELSSSCVMKIHHGKNKMLHSQNQGTNMLGVSASHRLTKTHSYKFPSFITPHHRHCFIVLVLLVLRNHLYSLSLSSPIFLNAPLLKTQSCSLGISPPILLH